MSPVERVFRGNVTLTIRLIGVAMVIFGGAILIVTSRNALPDHVETSFGWGWGTILAHAGILTCFATLLPWRLPRVVGCTLGSVVSYAFLIAVVIARAGWLIFSIAFLHSLVCAVFLYTQHSPWGFLDYRHGTLFQRRRLLVIQGGPECPNGALRH